MNYARMYFRHTPKEKQVVRYVGFILCVVFILLVFLSNLNSIPALVNLNAWASPYLQGLGIANPGWNIFSGGGGVRYNTLVRLKYEYKNGKVAYKQMLGDTSIYVPSAMKEYSLKFSDSNPNVIDAYVQYQCRNERTPLNKVYVETASIPLEEWAENNHEYTTTLYLRYSIKFTTQCRN